MTSSPTPAVQSDARALLQPFVELARAIDTATFNHLGVGLTGLLETATMPVGGKAISDKCQISIGALAALLATQPATDAAVPAGEDVRYPVTAETLNDIVQPIMDRHAEYMGTEQVFFSRKACANMIIDALAQGAREVRAAAPKVASDTGAGWIVGSGDGKRWRHWHNGMPEWVESRDEATRYARRCDAEAVHREDEDAWRVVPYADAALATDATDGATGGGEVAQGTFACPICGEDKPHHHTPAVVDAYQNKRSRT